MLYSAMSRQKWSFDPKRNKLYGMRKAEQMQALDIKG